MSYLKTAVELGMQAAQQEFEKMAAGLGAVVSKAAPSALRWNGPATEAFLKRIGLGGAVGGVGGYLTGDDASMLPAALGGHESTRGRNAAIGALLGAGGLAGAGHLAQKNVYEQLGMTKQRALAKAKKLNIPRNEVTYGNDLAESYAKIAPEVESSLWPTLPENFIPNFNFKRYGKQLELPFGAPEK